MDILLQMPWFQVTAFASGWTAVGVIAYLLITGRGGIALRREVEAAKHVGDTFKTAWETSEARNEVLAEQVGVLNQQVAGPVMGYLETADRVLTALDRNRVLSEAREQLRAEKGSDG